MHRHSAGTKPRNQHEYREADNFHNACGPAQSGDGIVPRASSSQADRARQRNEAARKKKDERGAGIAEGAYIGNGKCDIKKAAKNEGAYQSGVMFQPVMTLKLLFHRRVLELRPEPVKFEIRPGVKP
jgi:hypothetical protein